MTNKIYAPVSATAPAKYIIIGEHAVVHGEPALAAPLNSVYSTATLRPVHKHNTTDLYINAPDINFSGALESMPHDNPIANIVRQTLQELHYQDSIPGSLTVTSTIPIASGLGSSASISTAISRCIIKYLGHNLTNDEISQIVFKTESLQHGNPSGIDNTVIAHEVPMLFSKASPPQHLRPTKPLYYVLADTGQTRSTMDTLNIFRKQSRKKTTLFQESVRSIGKIAKESSLAFQDADHIKLGNLMSKNHALLQKLGVSTPELDKLVTIAIASGANGAKLSGAGHGGHIIAQVSQQTMSSVVNALKDIGSKPLTAIINP